MNIKELSLTSIVLLTLAAGSVAAQALPGYSQPEVAAYYRHLAEAKKPHSIKERSTAKTTALQSRVIAEAYSQHNGFEYQLTDSFFYKYSGERVGDPSSEPIKSDSLTIYEVSFGTVTRYALETNLFDAADNITRQTLYRWNSFASVYEPNESSIYTYNTAGQMLTDSATTWDGIDWSNHEKTINHYNAAALPDTITSLSWASSSWRNANRYVYSYTATNKVASLTYFNWNGASGKWDTSMHTVLTYDAAKDNLIKEHTFFWDPITKALYNYARTSYTYNAANNLTDEESETWNSFDKVWETGSYYIYKYNTAKKRIEAIEGYKDPSTSIFYQLRHTLYDYNSHQQLLNERTEDWGEDSHTWEHSVFNYERQFYYEEFTPASIKEEAGSQALKLYPMPAKDAFRIEMKLNTAQNMSLSIYDLQGRILLSASYPDTKQLDENISVANIPSGNYFIQLIGTKGAQVARQIIVAH